MPDNNVNTFNLSYYSNDGEFNRFLEQLEEIKKNNPYKCKIADKLLDFCSRMKTRPLPGSNIPIKDFKVIFNDNGWED